MENRTKIIAIGGGAFEPPEPEVIGKEILRLSGKKHPKVLFIPTASSDDPEYWEEFCEVYGGQLGCRPEVLWLLRESPSKKQIRENILSADIIFVGGGNTLKMMRRWRRLGVDRILAQARNKGTVLCGSSAGAICWFNYGHSDSMGYYHPEMDWKYIRVRGLGWFNATACPHFHGEERVRDFGQMIQKQGGVGIAIDDHCAFEIVGDQYRVIASKPEAMAYRIYKKEGHLITEIIDQKKKFLPLDNLI